MFHSVNNKLLSYFDYHVLTMLVCTNISNNTSYIYRESYSANISNNTHVEKVTVLILVTIPHAEKIKC